ncbi:hypothetical protein GLAREA_10087 [Glarea lozoyensis ATCC 20868]|uniref:Uncharacterized protein n=1 Tax=Glarea lozoyensis (strain ATCC 20868 / MF5171) TaxID=1116229 RepID=S3E7T0_GLAL2|nr:uncharacterized protein GLAREA_10087 [Glarea lozoyensis ATCC 20868]EPE34393.1 hypothetical protein GLAREA_10087 [Glarea lozoyensis ATCC 20868]
MSTPVIRRKPVANSTITQAPPLTLSAKIRVLKQKIVKKVTPASPPPTDEGFFELPPLAVPLRSFKEKSQHIWSRTKQGFRGFVEGVAALHDPINPQPRKLVEWALPKKSGSAPKHIGFLVGLMARASWHPFQPAPTLGPLPSGEKPSLVSGTGGLSQAGSEDRGGGSGRTAFARPRAARPGWSCCFDLTMPIAAYESGDGGVSI